MQDNILGEQFNQNPFANILAQIQSQNQPSGGAVGGVPSEPSGGMHQMPNGQMMPNSQMPGTMGGQGKSPPNQLRSGEDTSSSPMLLGAVQSLQKYITQEDNSDNIMIARSVIALLTKLIAKDQEEQTAKIPQDQEQLQAMAPPQTVGGPMG